MTENVVARDGIEPPTPAFSGPRSTTELPGLSADLKLSAAADAGSGGRERWESPLAVRSKQPSLVYQSGISAAKPGLSAPGLAQSTTLEGNHATPVYFLACFALALAAAAYSQIPPKFVLNPAATGQGTESRAASAYNTAVKAGPEALRAFLEGFPKGADLHVHLSGAVYAETFIRDAGEDGLCVDPAALEFAKPPCTGTLVPATQLSGNISSANQALYDRLIDSFSMRSFVPSAGWSGHDQFFATFGRFGGLSKTHTAEWVDEVASRAAAQNEQYLELMETPPFSHAAQIAQQIGWSPALAQADQQAFAQFRQQLLDRDCATRSQPTARK